MHLRGEPPHKSQGKTQIACHAPSLDRRIDMIFMTSSTYFVAATCTDTSKAMLGTVRHDLTCVSFPAVHDVPCIARISAKPALYQYGQQFHDKDQKHLHTSDIVKDTPPRMLSGRIYQPKCHLM